MSKSIYFKQITSAFMVFVMAAGIMLAAPAGAVVSAETAYESVYPTRILEEIVYADIEGCEVGKPVTAIDEPWADPGNNQNDYPYVCEIDGGKALCYEGIHSYSTFIAPNKTNVTGNLWVDVDVKLPAEYTRYTLQIGDFTHPDRALISFYSDEDRMRAMYVQDPDGGVKHIDLAYNIPREEWFTVSLWFNTTDQRFRVYLNGEQVGGEMNFYHKYDYVQNGTEPTEAAFAKLSYASNGSSSNAADAAAKLYMDNFRLSYAREIEEISTIEITLDKGATYTFPETYTATLDDGSTIDLDIKYDAVAEELDTNTLGSYHYVAEIEYYSQPVDVWFYVVEREIATIEPIDEKIYKNQEYTLPQKVMATMSDGSQKEVSVVWSGVVDTTVTGTSVLTGTVEGYDGVVTLNIEVVPGAVLRADDLYIGVARGTEYKMPETMPVTFDNHKRGHASVTWEEAAASVDTSKEGKYEFSGTAEGYSEEVKLHVTVYEKDGDLDYIVEVLTEYYDNCLTIARDRSAWFPEEYAAGYDPATPDIISDNPHSPLFSMGIDRDTNTHALWPSVSRDMPLAVPATQGPLWKGLMGMTALTGDEKYYESVEEAHGYLINNYVSEDSKMIRWGDHELQMFDDPELDNQDRTDAYTVVHQLECDYPEWDVLFSQNPEATERYIKAFWVSHFNGQRRGILLNTMEFSRHAGHNTWDLDLIDNVFKNRYDFDEVLVHKESANALTFVNAAVDYAWAAVKLWQNTGDEDALHYARKLLWCYHAAADPTTGLVPFQFTDTGGNANSFIGDVYEDNYKTSFPEGRAKSSYSKVYNNPEKYGTTAEKVNDSWLLNQGKCGGGSFYMPMICFDIADVVGGEVGAEIEQWGIDALMGFVNYTYDHKTGLGKSGMTDGTVLDDYKPDFKAYYSAAGRAQFPFEITSDMSWVLLDGYERTKDPAIWECLRSVCMSYSIGDIGTAPGENVDLEMYMIPDDTNILLTLSRLYEITGHKDYYTLGKRMAKQIINKRFINGFFYKFDIGAYARLADPTPYALLYFVAASEGISKMIPHYQGESFDFQTNYVQTNGDIDTLYGYSLFNQKIVSEVLASAVLCDDTEITLKVGDQYMINAQVVPEDADDVSLEWDVDNAGCCSVVDGYVTALSPGKCTVTAEASSGVSAKIVVTVTQ